MRASERLTANEALEQARSAKTQADAAIAIAEERVSREEDADATAAALTHLVENGERLGLHDGHSPLCAARRTDEEFASGLEAARRWIASLSSGVQNARNELALAQENARHITEALRAAEALVARHTADEARLRAREQAQVEIFDKTGLPHASINDPNGLEGRIAAERNRLIDLERALLMLEVSQFVSRVASIQNNIASLREEQEKSAETMRKSQAALNAARNIERSVKRVSSEIIDERLAQISHCQSNSTSAFVLTPSGRQSTIAFAETFGGF
jgi:hypothetical protein